MATFVYPTVLTTIDTGDLATLAKQDTIITELQGVNSELDSVTTKQDTMITELQGIETDVEAVGTKLDTANDTLTSIDGKDFATQTTLASQASDISELNAKLGAALVPTAYDYVALTYVASGDGIGEIETATYKTGGSGGTTVATLTLAYDANDKLASVTKS